MSFVRTSRPTPNKPLSGLVGRLCELVLQEAGDFQISNCQLTSQGSNEAPVIHALASACSIGN
jgi:hypothetical protein